MPSTTESEDAFEDVGLNDETSKQPQAAKKRGFLSRFGDQQPQQPPASADSTPPGTADAAKAGGLGLGFHFPGRKRGQSGVGAELGNMERPGSAKGMKNDGVIR